MTGQSIILNPDSQDELMVPNATIFSLILFFQPPNPHTSSTYTYYTQYISFQVNYSKMIPGAHQLTGALPAHFSCPECLLYMPWRGPTTYIYNRLGRNN
jgi:hypothetical protein